MMEDAKLTGILTTRPFAPEMRFEQDIPPSYAYVSLFVVLACAYWVRLQFWAIAGGFEPDYLQWAKVQLLWWSHLCIHDHRKEYLCKVISASIANVYPPRISSPDSGRPTIRCCPTFRPSD